MNKIFIEFQEVINQAAKAGAGKSAPLRGSSRDSSIDTENISETERAITLKFVRLMQVIFTNNKFCP